MNDMMTNGFDPKHPIRALGFPRPLSDAAEISGFTEREVMNAINNKIVPYYDVDDKYFLHPEEIKALQKRRDYGLVYAIGFSRYVKIGFTQDIDLRVRTLQHGAPLKLEVYRTIRGCRLDESALHKRFAKSRLQREWFFMDRDVAAWARGARD